MPEWSWMTSNQLIRQEFPLSPFLPSSCVPSCIFILSSPFSLSIKVVEMEDGDKSKKRKRNGAIRELCGLMPDVKPVKVLKGESPE